MDTVAEGRGGFQPDKPDRSRDLGESGSLITDSSASCAHSRLRPILGLKVAACEECGQVVGFDYRELTKV